jgi:uncharacterized glyoxalase superfamily protein PhnB
MTTQTSVHLGSMFPCVFYRDANAAIDWLVRAFGFEKVMVVPGEDGAVAHSELRLGDGMIMVGTAGRGSLEGTASPLDAGGVTASTYVYVDDAELEQHYERAKAAGAEITLPLKRNDYGGAGYSAHDLEGHHWSFGSYMPAYPAPAQ